MDSMKLCAVVLFLNVPLVFAWIKCYDCIAPEETSNWDTYCSEKKYCEGDYCTRGRNAKSNGVLYGCSSTPPLENNVVSECKFAWSATGSLKNCYCKNNNFCNKSSSATRAILTLVTPLAAIFTFITLL